MNNKLLLFNAIIDKAVFEKNTPRILHYKLSPVFESGFVIFHYDNYRDFYILAKQFRKIINDELDFFILSKMDILNSFRSISSRFQNDPNWNSGFYFELYKFIRKKDQEINCLTDI